MYNKVAYILFHLLIVRTKIRMAQTKQTPKNPHISQPTTAIGSDVQPEQRTNPKPSKAPMKGGKQPRKHLSQKVLR